MFSITLSGPQQTEPGRLATADTYWRSLYFFNGYRFVVALLLLAAATFFGDTLSFGSQDFRLFVYASAGYVMFSVVCFVLITMRRHFHLQLGLQIGADILLIVVMMFASGGIPSGLGLLLLSALAAAGLISRGRLTLFYASLASIAILIEQTVQVLYFSEPTTQYVQAGLLSISYFAIAWVAHTLARYLVATEKLAAQREIDLANMAEVNQLVLDDMQDGVLVVDEQGVIRQHNARAEAMLGPLHRQRRQPLLKDYAPLLAEQFALWRSNPVAVLDAAAVLLSDKVSARFMGVGRNRNVGAVIFLEDLTQVQAQARQMKLASLGRLTANIAHEIRNPLSAISHAAELLQEESAAGGTVGRLLTIVSDNVGRLNRVVTDVLRLNRGERAHTERFPLVDFLTTFVEQFIQNEKIDQPVFELELAASPEVMFDRSHLNQVMWNLCRNALRHCRKERGSIRIVVDVIGEGNVVKLDVVDDGLGVPAAVRGQLFEPFFTTEASGTGLGLYLAREICEANGATLECVEVPRGAQFTILCQGA